MSKLILIRGLPGSGKSTLAREMLSDGAADAHFEADMWLCLESAYDGRGFFKGFTTVARDYYWSPERIKAAHAACIEAATLALRSGKTVVVSNTFTKLWEMQPYLDAAKTLGANVDVMLATGEYGSVHNVPKEVMDAMKARFEDGMKIGKRMMKLAEANSAALAVGEDVKLSTQGSLEKHNFSQG